MGNEKYKKLLQRDKAYIDKLAKCRCMNNAKWRKFFLTALAKIKEIKQDPQIIGGEMICKSPRDSDVRQGFTLDESQIGHDPIRDPGFGGPQYYWTIEWILIKSIRSRSLLTGNYSDNGLTEELFAYLQTIAKFPLYPVEEGIIIKGYQFDE